jgi:hypothetical protein
MRDFAAFDEYIVKVCLGKLRVHITVIDLACCNGREDETNSARRSLAFFDGRKTIIIRVRIFNPKHNETASRELEERFDVFYPSEMESQIWITFYFGGDNILLFANINEIHQSADRVESPDEMTDKFRPRNAFSKSLLETVAIGVDPYELQDGDAIAFHGWRVELCDCREELFTRVAAPLVALLNEIEVKLEI